MAGLFRRPEGPPQLGENGTVDSNIKWERRPQDPPSKEPNTELTSPQPAQVAKDQEVLVNGDPSTIVLESETAANADDDVIEALDGEDAEEDEDTTETAFGGEQTAKVHLS